MTIARDFAADPLYFQADKGPGWPGPSRWSLWHALRVRYYDDGKPRRGAYCGAVVDLWPKGKATYRTDRPPLGVLCATCRRIARL